jgi:hypothetical protein
MSHSFKRGRRVGKSSGVTVFDRTAIYQRTVEALRAACPNPQQVAARMGFHGPSHVYRWLSDETPNPLARVIQLQQIALEVADENGYPKEDALAPFLLLQEIFGAQLAEHCATGTTAAAFTELADVMVTTGHAGRRVAQWARDGKIADHEMARFDALDREQQRQWAELRAEMHAANERYHQERGNDPEPRRLREVKR